MKNLLKRGWISILVWIVVIVTVVITLPNITELVRDKGTVTFSKHYSSTIADNIIKEMNQSNNIKSAQNSVSMTLVYNTKNKLTENDKAEIKSKVDNLIDHKNQYGLLTIQNPFSDSTLADILISKDGTTLLVPITVDRGSDTVASVRTRIEKVMKTNGVTLYTTSSDLITEDFSQETENGVKETELITIIFILIILLLIFKSPVTPLVNLITVSLAFIVSLNITFQFVKYLNFPVSNFTEIYLVLILFGIGTDYIMLLLTRFREELRSGAEKNEAIQTTYKTSGKTVLFSSLTILIGFSCLYFAQFKIYQSAAAVAIGVAVLDIVLFTFVPILMKLFGARLFWSPFKARQHSENKGWEKTAKFSTKYPFIALIFTGLVCCLIFLYNGNLSFNNLKEVNSSYPSIKGYNVVTSHFSAGQSMPLTIAIKNQDAMNSQSDLAAIESLTKNINAIKGVSNVYSVTRPNGVKIDDLYLNSQIQSVNSGLSSAQGGIKQVTTGLQSAISQLQAATQDNSSLGQLQSGTAALSTGLDTVTASSGKLSTGLEALKTGSSSLSYNLQRLNTSCSQLGSGLTVSAGVSGQITQGITEISSSLSSMQTMLDSMISNYNALNGGLTQLGNTLPDIQQNLTSAGSKLSTISTNLTDLTGQLSQLSNSSTYLTELGSIASSTQSIETSLNNVGSDATKIQQILTSLSGSDESQSLGQAQAGLTSMANALAELESASSSLTGGLITSADAQKQITAATAQLADGAKQLDSGLTDVSDGQAKMTDAVAHLSSGAKQLQEGQAKLVKGIEAVASQSKELSTGLDSAVNGLNEVSSGLDSANSYLNGLSSSSLSGNTFYIPNDQINSGDFLKSINSYMSANRKITEITFTLNIDPYSSGAMSIINEVHSEVDASLKNAPFKNATYGIAGLSQQNVDLKAISDSDFSNLRFIMLLGIFVVLLIIFRSFWIPVFLMGTLIASYFIASTLSGILFRFVLNIPQLSWMVPFCSFIMIVALGVDYGIFLIMRFKENKDMSESESMILACRKVGGVITSAALILSGTFAAMYPSGVLTLMELAVTVIIGLILLCFVFMPIAIPALVSLKARLAERSSK